MKMANISFILIRCYIVKKVINVEIQANVELIRKINKTETILSFSRIFILESMGGERDQC